MSTKDEQRLFDLRYLRAQIDAEIAVLEWENRPKWTRTPKGQRPDCGTTRGYDWHRNHDELPACDDLSEPAARWADLFGAAPNYTGGVPVDEWLEAHRG